MNNLIDSIKKFPFKQEFTIVFSLVIGLILIAIHGILYKSINLVMLSLASSSIGVFLGFLFGLPIHKKAKEYEQNTNLQQISDWLTKILVGVGLTQIPNATQYISKLVNFIQNSQDKNDHKSLILSIIVYFNILGFMGGYLWSRLSLPKAFSNADNIDEKLDKRDKKDFLALSKVYLHLSGENIKEDNKTKLEILETVLSDATQTARVNVFYQAHEIRRTNSPFASNASSLITIYRMERVIPIFQALISTYQSYTEQSDVVEPIDRYYGELGYAL